MNKKWVLREKISDELEKQLLFYRGIKTEEEAEKFFHPDYERDLRDPFGFPVMEKIVSRIAKAIEVNEKIVVFGDYDADGICACVIFHDFFKKIGFENFQAYIPDRSQEGYGLNLKAIDEFIKQKTGLIITVDCGITDIEEIKKANAAGIDVIVIDHHLASQGVPPAFAVLDLFIEGEEHPFKQFCGAGLAFKVVSALVKNDAFKITSGWEKWLLDVAAIATVADRFPLIDESRILVFYGLEVLKKTRRKGLHALFRKLQIDKLNITEDDIGFYIAPCINVASRMDHATISYSLLITESDEEAEALSSRLVELNNERKKKTEEIFGEIDSKLEGMENLPEILVLGDEKWPLGVLSLLANKILEKYNRPAIVWGRGKTEIQGSCRSNGKINLVELLTAIGDKMLDDFGGHALASGFSIKEGKISELNKEVEKAYEKVSHYEIELPYLWLDVELNLENVDWHLIELLEKFRPFGMANAKPVFLFSNLEVYNAKTFGNGGIHLQLDFKKPSGEVVPAIGFFMQQRLDFDIAKDSQVDLAASIEKSMFKGYPELRMRIVDVRPAQ
ncbi:MAG: single-stranded-DNA-specific exonuclease RecJ [bacterium]|nr:single-stranded-DNA-specific exonuclease RecJ [bacterium]